MLDYKKKKLSELLDKALFQLTKRETVYFKTLGDSASSKLLKPANIQILYS